MTYNLNYFTAKLLKDGRITIPQEVREVYNLKEGERLVFQFVKRMPGKVEPK